jgi:hypothetical protein
MRKKKNNEPLDTGGAEANEIWGSLPKPSGIGRLFAWRALVDKDVDEHMLFVTACSNTRHELFHSSGRYSSFSRHCGPYHSSHCHDDRVGGQLDLLGVQDRWNGPQGAHD